MNPQPSYLGTLIPGCLSGTLSPWMRSSTLLQAVETCSLWKAGGKEGYPLVLTAESLLIFMHDRSSELRDCFCWSALSDLFFQQKHQEEATLRLGKGKKHPVDIVNGTENSPTNSVSLFAVMLCIDFSSSFLGHLHASKPKPHHSSNFD